MPVIKRHLAISVTGFADEQLDNLEKQIKGRIRKLNVQDIKDYLKSDDSLAVLQWQLLKNLKEGGLPINLQDETIRWLFNDREAMENLLASGDMCALRNFMFNIKGKML